jgi:hypothetical protein
MQRVIVLKQGMFTAGLNGCTARLSRKATELERKQWTVPMGGMAEFCAPLTPFYVEILPSALLQLQLC